MTDEAAALARVEPRVIVAKALRDKTSVGASLELADTILLALYEHDYFIVDAHAKCFECDLEFSGPLCLVCGAAAIRAGKGA